MTDEGHVMRWLQAELGLTFEVGPYRLGTWGEADGWARLAADAVLVIEVEATQHHPNTNVSKLWPWLEEHPQLKVILVQVFMPGSHAQQSSRGRLAEWLASRMQAALRGRFTYRRLRAFDAEELAALATEIKPLCEHRGR